MKKPHIIICAGVIGSGLSLLTNAITNIIKMSGYTVDVKDPMEEKWFESDKDFIVCKINQFSVDHEDKADLIFCSTRDSESLSKYFEEGIYGVAKAYEQLFLWLGSKKFAYLQNYNLPINRKGLHNFNNLTFMIMPLNYKFQPKIFNKINPAKLIESLSPEIKQKSEEAAKRTDGIMKKHVDGED